MKHTFSSFIGGLIMYGLNRHFEHPGEGNANIKICVFQHFKCMLPSCFENRSIFIPIQAGRALSEPIDGLIGDDTGDNISRYNRLLNEITAIYWAGTHYAELGSPDYIGFNHYRRYLEWSYGILSKRVVVASRLLTLKSQAATFGQYHQMADLDAFRIRFKARFGHEYPDFGVYWNIHVMCVANCFIMDRETFFTYFAFLKKCLMVIFEMMDEHAIPVEMYDAYQSRIYGFIMERMTSYFIFHIRKAGTCKFVSTRLRSFDMVNPINGTR